MHATDLTVELFFAAAALTMVAMALSQVLFWGAIGVLLAGGIGAMTVAICWLKLKVGAPHFAVLCEALAANPLAWFVLSAAGMLILLLQSTLVARLRNQVVPKEKKARKAKASQAPVPAPTSAPVAVQREAPAGTAAPSPGAPAEPPALVTSRAEGMALLTACRRFAEPFSAPDAPPFGDVLETHPLFRQICPFLSAEFCRALRLRQRGAAQPELLAAFTSEIGRLTFR